MALKNTVSQARKVNLPKNIVVRMKSRVSGEKHCFSLKNTVFHGEKHCFSFLTHSACHRRHRW